MSDHFFHIGLHKTATSTLQKEFFPACNGLNLLLARIPAVRDFTNYVIAKDPVHFDPEIATGLLKPHVTDKSPNLLSFENLSGPPFTGIHHGVDYRTPILHKLKRSHPKAGIILVIRRQDSLAKSFYRQYVKTGGTASISRFYGWTGPRWRMAMASPDRFRFGPYLAELDGLFGDNILVMPFEAFKDDCHGFLKRMTEFVGVEMPDVALSQRNATRLGPFGMELTRFLNRISPFRSQVREDGLLPGVPIMQRLGGFRWSNPISLAHDHWPKLRKPPTEKENRYYGICREILELVKGDNEEIDRKYGLGLHKFGYY